MPKPRVLIVFHTVEGQSEKIAISIADTLRSEGLDVEMDDASTAPSPAGYDGAVLGDSIHAVKHSGELRAYLAAHAADLNKLPTGLFQVSLTSTNPDEGHTMAANELVERLLTETGFTPTVVATFAGRIAYSQYGWFKRHLMRWIVRREGGDTDMSHDHEYTDWHAVETFAQRVASLVTKRTEKVAP